MSVFIDKQESILTDAANTIPWIVALAP